MLSVKTKSENMCAMQSVSQCLSIKRRRAHFLSDLMFTRASAQWYTLCYLFTLAVCIVKLEDARFGRCRKSYEKNYKIVTNKQNVIDYNVESSDRV